MIYNCWYVAPAPIGVEAMTFREYGQVQHWIKAHEDAPYDGYTFLCVKNNCIFCALERGLTVHYPFTFGI